MFQQRQFNELQNVEISFTASINPGAIANGAVASAAVACTLGVTGGASAATFTLSDVLEVVPPAGAALNGVAVWAAPTATPGTARVVFQNNTGGSVTPNAATYQIIAYRAPANVVS